jgi:hypothetical protein
MAGAPSRRIIEPEWLDALPPADPRARAARGDLARVNRLMGNAGILARALRRGAGASAPRRIVDLGAGDGLFALGLARMLAPRWPGARLVLVDRAPCAAPETLAAVAAAGWRAETVAIDALAWCRAQGEATGDVIFANLFLHHLDSESLAALFDAAARFAASFAACEPRRSGPGLLGSRLLGLVGCNDVTRHDARASVRAGFAGRELSALWPRRGWSLQERAAGWCSHLFLARRDDDAA